MLVPSLSWQIFGFSLQNGIAKKAVVPTELLADWVADVRARKVDQARRARVQAAEAVPPALRGDDLRVRVYNETVATELL